MTTRRGPDSNTAEAVEYRNPPLLFESRWAWASASGSGSRVAAMSSRSAPSTPSVGEPGIKRVGGDPGVGGGSAKRVRVVERLTVGERSAPESAQQPVGARRIVQSGANVRATGLNRRRHALRRLGQHRHPVLGSQPARIARHHLPSESPLLVGSALLGENDHPPRDVEPVSVVPCQLGLLPLGVESERAPGIGVNRDLDSLHLGQEPTVGRSGSRPGSFSAPGGHRVEARVRRTDPGARGRCTRFAVDRRAGRRCRRHRGPGRTSSRSRSAPNLPFLGSRTDGICVDGQVAMALLEDRANVDHRVGCGAGRGEALDRRGAPSSRKRQSARARESSAVGSRASAKM